MAVPAVPIHTPLVAYALAHLLPADPNPFQASRLHPALSARSRERPPGGPGWLHEIKFDGYRVIARKDGERVRLWARTTSDYSKAFTRIRDAVATLPVESAVLDGEAIVMRSADRCDFEALRSRQGQAGAILVAYDIMEANGQDIRPEPLEERRKRLAKLVSRSNKALRDGIQLSEAITGDGATIFRHACWMDLEGIVSKRVGRVTSAAEPGHG